MKENAEVIIKDVYAHNFVQEMKAITSLLNQYPYIGMDTEFPGTLYSSSLTSYQAIKENTDQLKLIQVGITLSDENGNIPLNGGAWQFNLSFSLKNDKYSADSINMLVNSGINFANLETYGIPQEIFGEYFLSSGLVLNEELTWICFHGIYDFAYLLKTVTNLPLPTTEKTFFNDLKLYFPTFFDIRYLIRHNELLKGSLNRLSQELGIQRTGRQHQAGSDSLITSEVFFKLINEGYLHKNIFNDEKNLLFGISPDNPIMDLDNNQFMMNFGLGQSQPTYSTNVNDLNINNRNIETNTNTNPNPTSTLNTYQPYQPYFQNIHTQDTNHNRYYGFPNQAFSFARNRDNEEEKGTYGWN
jgi:CCR4-NOT transcription complex subunit 7/8